MRPRHTAVFTEDLAVIRHGEDRQIPQEPPLLESIEHAPDHGVHVRGLGVVEASRPLGGY